MELKREQLLFRIKELWKEYNEIRSNFLSLFKQSLIKLNQTYKEMGKYGVNLISKLSKIQYNPVVNVQYAKKAGILVSQISYNLSREENLPAYTFEDTSHFLDDLIEILGEFFEFLIKFSEIEDTILKYSLSFKKVNRRINGLKNIVIPRLRINIKRIRDSLEELERERYIRLKKIKDLIIVNQNSKGV